jgi:hypothetical protein
MGNVPCVSCAVVQRPTAPAPCRLDPTTLDPAIATPVIEPPCAHGILQERHGPTGLFTQHWELCRSNPSSELDRPPPPSVPAALAKEPCLGCGSQYQVGCHRRRPKYPAFPGLARLETGLDQPPRSRSYADRQTHSLPGRESKSDGTAPSKARGHSRTRSHISFHTASRMCT